MRSVSLAWQILRHMGPGWCAYRAYYAVARRSGALARRTPATAWEAVPLRRFLAEESLSEPERYLDYRCSPAAPAFLFKPTDRQRYQPLLAGFDDRDSTPIDEAEAILGGRFRFFSCHRLDAGFPPDWHRNHFTGERAPTAIHWSRIGTTGYGDIKCIWELSRFAWAYTLVRAYWRTGDERYAEAFWRLFEDWRAHNPPNTGPNWMCGQEVALRLMASCFALYGLLDSPATTPERVAMLGQLAAVSARRIRANIGYALSQRNNHGISEAMGLWTAGLLFPEFAAARSWRDLGARLLEREVLRLLYDDGSCSQHSVVYQRLMLHDCLWGIALGATNGQPLSLTLQGRVRRAAEFLYQLQDDESGEVPLYGSSDGALILPLSNAGYRDFRPVVQSAAFLTRGERLLAPGPWDEESLWLCGPSVVETARHLPSDATRGHSSPPATDSAPTRQPTAPRTPRTDLRAATRGYYTLRTHTGFALMRCGDYAPGHRPGQQDQLHVDIWWRGQNTATDAGTYSYNPPELWGHDFGLVAMHNTVDVDGRGQSDRVSSFLSLPWAAARITADLRSSRGRLAYLEGETNAYQRLADRVSYRRAVVRVGEEHWLVLDRLTGADDHTYRLHWLLGDWPCEWFPDEGRVLLSTPSGPYQVRLGCLSAAPGLHFIRAEEGSAQGWRAAHYLDREAALSLSATVKASGCTFWSLLGPPEACVSFERDWMRVHLADRTVTVHWSVDPTMRQMLSRVRVRVSPVSGKGY